MAFGSTGAPLAGKASFTGTDSRFDAVTAGLIRADCMTMPANMAEEEKDVCAVKFRAT